MMFLYQTFYNFRNIKNDTIDLSSREVYFVGENGQGKSNILESLYYSSYGVSFRTHIDSQIVKNGERDFSINSMYRKEQDDTQKVSVIFENNKKRIEKNGKKINDRKELINTIPCILFSHDDMRFATGEPECRRFFIDQSLTLYDSIYIDDIRNYKKILKSRNQILKNHEYEMLDVYDKQLAEVGIIIQEKRNKAIFHFNQIFGKIYEEITGIDDVSISYHPSWKNSDVMEILYNQREKDKVFETTLSGPHRDRIDFVRNHHLFVPTASTGQCRLISLLLRVAQSIYFTHTTGLKPVLLMDDVLLELDPDKRAKLTSMLPEYDQLFCTFLPGEPYERYMYDTTKIYKIKNGEWYE
ncbi:MAG: DNA replication and repair protein RecF [Treponema sp.]|uniref:DNA replication/repair protein RecF n=1 Tax=Treponema sp. TaxID=166 RepID=UPI00298E8F25|nr:DNA replication and repair protein RecF [Treponema sp.]MCQ2601430.1 DNA replication and repair protein RecF [Treponema sp.]